MSIDTIFTKNDFIKCILIYTYFTLSIYEFSFRNLVENFYIRKKEITFNHSKFKRVKLKTAIHKVMILFLFN